MTTPSARETAERLAREIDDDLWTGLPLPDGFNSAVVRIERALLDREAETERLRKEVERLTKQLIRAEEEAQYFPD